MENFLMAQWEWVLVVVILTILLAFFTKPRTDYLTVPPPPPSKNIRVATITVNIDKNSNLIKALAIVAKVEGMKAENIKHQQMGEGVLYTEGHFIEKAEEIESLMEDD